MNQEPQKTAPIYWRIDLWFSAWIFAWFLLYIFGVPLPSPMFALVCATISVTIVILFYDYRFSTYRVEFMTYFIILKLIPLAILFATEEEYTMDPLPTTCLFVIYIIYLHLNNYTFSYIYKLSLPSFLQKL
jgi:hypothetical protein